MKTNIILFCGVALFSPIQAMAAIVGSLTTVYSENFNSTNFQGSYLGDVGNTSDLWTNPTKYYQVNNYDGWTFTSGAYYAHNNASDGAVLLNENGPGTASYTINDLTIGGSYDLKFNYGGDNMPGQTYSLVVNGNGQQIYNSGIQHNGILPINGGLVDIAFLANSSSETFEFIGSTLSTASPIFTNVLITTPAPVALPAAVPVPAAVWLFGSALAGFMGINHRNPHRNFSLVTGNILKKTG